MKIYLISIACLALTSCEFLTNPAVVQVEEELAVDAAEFVVDEVEKFEQPQPNEQDLDNGIKKAEKQS